MDTPRQPQLKWHGSPDPWFSITGQETRATLRFPIATREARKPRASSRSSRASKLAAYYSRKFVTTRG